MAQQSIAAASSSASTSYRCYDVFINHRGPDVKDTFASHLYRRLFGHGLQVFLDREELEEGHQISSQIEGAIRVASVQIAIFSPTYAESYWCLNELLLMVSSGATILPVFYRVEPSMLRRAIGPYGEALHNLQQKTTCDPLTGEKKPRYDSNTIQSWRNALSHVADISGFVLHGDEGDLLEKVVQDVLKKVSKTPLDVAKYPTGLGEKLQEFERTVQESKTAGAKVVGIVGLGGIGKTTLAKEFFNLRRSYYDASSFLFDVRENARTSLAYLQSKLIKDLKHSDIRIENRDQGIGELKKYLSSCHVLIILDDVDHIDQMDAFLPITDILSQESLILVTSRDKHVLRSSGVLDSSIYNLQGLNRTDSEELFCCYAFCLHHPLPGFADLVDRFVMACNGLPLSLKVFGALVCGQKQSYWQGILDRLGQLPTEIQERLRISYDSLDEDDQSIFLDIVCFFIGDIDTDIAIEIWGRVGLQNLENKCLLEVDSDKLIKMHDHITDMGRCIAKGLMPRRFYERTSSNVLDILEQSSSVITEVRGISMENCSVASIVLLLYSHDSSYKRYSDMSRYERWRHDVLENGMWKLCIKDLMWKLSMKDRYHGTNLKFILMKDGYLRDILTRVKLPQLIWLRWYDCPYTSLPSWVPIKNLKVLEVGGIRLTMLWQSETQAPLDLRRLVIFAPLSYFPKSIGQLKHLEVISWDCHGTSQLKTLPKEFCNLCSLKYLGLQNCSIIRSLPESFGKLTNLGYIELSKAQNLQSLPESFGELINLQHIRLSDAKSLKSLPESLGKLTNLQHIELSHVQSLESLPESFGELTNLQDIDLSFAKSLKSLPESFGRLSNLQHIRMFVVSNLQMIPNSFGNLTKLQHLSLIYASGLQMLPDSLGKLTNLQVLDLTGAYRLETLPNSFGNLSRLKHLNLTWCRNLSLSSGTLGNITTLEYLNLWCCYKVKELPPQVAGQPSLKSLNLCGTKLKELPSGVGNLSNLEELRIGSDSLEELPPSLVYLERLKVLYLSCCPKLKCWPESFGLLTQWTELSINLDGCIDYTPHALCNREKRLVVLDCPLLELPETVLLKGRGALNTNSKDNCTFGLKLLQLCYLKEKEWDNITFPEGVCPNLQQLSVSHCTELRQIGELCGLAKLQFLNIVWCENLEELPSLETLISLERLQVSKCPKLKSIEGLAHLTKLKKICVYDCNELRELAGVEHAMALEQLQLIECPKVKLRQRLKEGLRIENKKGKDSPAFKIEPFTALPKGPGTYEKIHNRIKSFYKI